MKKVRLDEYLILNGFAEDKKIATGLILSGRVRSGTQVLDKPGELIDPDSDIYVKDVMEYVSRGGLKLKKAAESFSIDFKGKVVMDIGCSTGGFTDYSLKNGAKKVFAIDVGKGVLDYNLRNDDRVVVKEGLNFKHIVFDDIGEYPDIIVGDLSFISLKSIYEPLLKFCRDGTQVIFLIKPQFESLPHEVEKGGVVKNKDVHKRVICDIISKYQECFECCGLTVSPIKGAKGNIEYLVFFVYNGKAHISEGLENIVDKVVDEEYCYHCEATR